MAIILDRLCDLSRRQLFPDGFGGFTVKETDIGRFWCQTRSAGTVEVQDPGGAGSYIAQRKQFTLRYDHAVFSLPPGEIRVVDDYMRRFAVQGIDELESIGHRRRFMVLDAELRP